MDAPLRVELGDLSKLGDGQMHAREAGQFAVVVCRAQGRLYALEDLCSHADTTLSDGVLSGYVVTCPLHGAQFDVRDGSHLTPPAYTGIRSFPITEDTDGAVIEVPATREPDDGGFGGPQTIFRTR